MKANTILLEKLELLVSKGKYSEALRVIEGIGLQNLYDLPSLRDQTALLLVIADIYYNAQLFNDAERCLSLLSDRVSESEDDIRFVVLKAQVLIGKASFIDAMSLLERAISRDWDASQHHLLLFHAGAAYFWSGDYIKANRYWQSCYQYYLAVSDNYMVGCSLSRLGFAAFQRSFFEIAESYYRRAIESFGNLDRGTAKREFQLGQIHQLLGIVAYRKGMYDASRKELSLARMYFGKCSYRIGLLNSRIAYARIAMFQGQYTTAEAMLQETFKWAEAIDNKRGVALSAEFLGEVYYLQSRYEDALKYLAIAEEHAMQMAPRGDHAVEVYRRKGDVLVAIGREEEADEVLNEALEIAQHLHDRYELGSILRALGSLAARRGDIATARSHFNEAIATLRLIKEPFELARTYFVAADLNAHWSQLIDIAPDMKAELLDEARAYAIEGMHLYTSISLEDRARECRELLERLGDGSHREAGSANKISMAFDRRHLVGDILVARSQHMQDVVREVKQCAPSKIPIMILGETGTGKELVARLIHSLSERSRGPFIPVNCASLPEPVFESEVFGHRRGSFTGAIRDKMGLMEQASGGTLLLDEISELSNAQQAKLLRALQEGMIRRVGETRERPVDVRIICASNSNLEELLTPGRFRKDLFYRVAGQVIDLEPLRRRQDDIPPLFAYYVSKSGKAVSAEDGLVEMLCHYPWPGNARELVNIVNALLLAADGTGVMRIRDLPIKIRDYMLSERQLASTNNRGSMGERDNVCTEPSDGDRALKELIAASLERCGGNRSEAARELGIGRSTLYRRLRELGLIEN